MRFMWKKLSALAPARPVYEGVTSKLKPGDTFVILDLGRAYRSAKDALSELDRLHARGVDIQIANLNVDTSTPFGKVIHTIISALAEFERAMLSDRTKQGLEAARRRGKRIGRPPKISDRKVRIAQQKLATGEATLNELAALNGVHAWTLRRRLAVLMNDDTN